MAVFKDSCGWCRAGYHELCGVRTPAGVHEICACLCPLSWPQDKEVTEADREETLAFMTETFVGLHIDSVTLEVIDGVPTIVVASLVEEDTPPVPAHLAPVAIEWRVVEP